MKAPLALSLLLGTAVVLCAPKVLLTEEMPLPPRSKDADELDRVIESFHRLLSGPPGPKDWQRVLDLFHPEAGWHMPVLAMDEGAKVEILTPAAYKERMAPYFARNAHFEREIARRVERFGHLAQVFSTFESRKTPDVEKPPESRGIHAFQLVWDGTRWWILSVAWEHERVHQELPARYLTSDK